MSLASMSVDDRWERALADLVTRYVGASARASEVDEATQARTRILQYASTAIESASEYLSLLESATDTAIIGRARDQDENAGILLRYLILKYMVFRM